MLVYTDKYLSDLKKLKEVNLKNHILDLKYMSNLKDEFQYINFVWDIYYNNQYFDLSTIELNLSNKKYINYDDLKYLLNLLTNLKKLEISDTNLSNEELGKLRELFPNVNIVWKLHLGKWSLMTDDTAFSVLVGKINYERMSSKDIEVLKYCTNLQALDLGHQAIDDISVIGNYLKDLRILILADNKIKDISSLGNLKHLHYLELFVNQIEDFSILAELNELVDINIGYNKVTDINQLLNINGIERFWLVNGGITESERVILSNAYPNAIVNTSWSLSSTERGWRNHPRYDAMIDMFHNRRYISLEFSKYDRL